MGMKSFFGDSNESMKGSGVTKTHGGEKEEGGEDIKDSSMRSLFKTSSESIKSFTMTENHSLTRDRPDGRERTKEGGTSDSDSDSDDDDLKPAAPVRFADVFKNKDSSMRSFATRGGSCKSMRQHTLHEKHNEDDSDVDNDASDEDNLEPAAPMRFTNMQDLSMRSLFKGSTDSMQQFSSLQLEQTVDGDHDDNHDDRREGDNDGVDTKQSNFRATPGRVSIGKDLFFDSPSMRSLFKDSKKTFGQNKAAATSNQLDREEDSDSEDNLRPAQPTRLNSIQGDTHLKDSFRSLSINTDESGSSSQLKDTRKQMNSDEEKLTNEKDN